jgi:endonuclease/exonuclease/phosphatase (EEP) superfamily protein YafD
MSEEPLKSRSLKKERSLSKAKDSFCQSGDYLALICRIFRWIRLIVFWGCFGLAILVAWISVSIESEMENNLFLSTLSYVPIWVPLVPIVLVFPLALLFSKRAAILLTLAGCTYYFLHVSPQYHEVAENGSVQTLGNLRVMSFNAGQSRQVDYLALMSALSPDVVLLQEVRGWLKKKEASACAALFPFRHQTGEFVILSKHPVQASEEPTLTMPFNGHDKVCACSYRLLVFGRRVTIFNVHIPSPRELLLWHGGKGTFLLGIAHWMSPSLDDWHEERALAWKERAYTIQKLAKLVKREPNLAIVAGDLNSPPWGGGYLALDEIMDDAFAACGNGFGSTFPAESNSLPSFAVPWLRLDYVFVRGGGVTEFRTHKLGRMQHLPICAEITLPNFPIHQGEEL